MEIEIIIELEMARPSLIQCPLNEYNFTHKFILHKSAPTTFRYLQLSIKNKEKRKSCIGLEFQ